MFAAVTLAATLAGTVSARQPGQETSDPRAKAVIEQAAEALKTLDTARATITLSGDASGPMAGFLQQTFPSGQATLTFARSGVERAPVLRLAGSGRGQGATGPTTAFDVVRRPGEATWIDHEAKTVISRNGERIIYTRGAGAGVFEQILPMFLLDDEPFADELGTAAFASEQPEQRDGQPAVDEPCDVVLVTYPKQEPGQRTARSRRLFDQARWYIARSDRLPRRVEQITSSEQTGTIKLIATWTRVETDVLLDDDEFGIAAPDGYRVQDQRRDTGAERPAGSPTPAVVTTQVIEPGTLSTPGTQTRPQEPPRRRAPGFELSTPDGRTVSLEGRSGRVTVLYFWGSWCPPCADYSPLVSALAERYAEQPVGVFGLSVRERTRDAPQEVMQTNGFQHTLLLDADNVARRYRVRLYPTIVVIGKDGTIFAQKSIERDRTPAEVVADVDAAVEQALRAD